MNEKLTLTAEFNKNDIAGICYVLGEELTDELWEKLSKEPIKVDFNKIDKEERKLVKSRFMSAAIISANIQE